MEVLRLSGTSGIKRFVAAPWQILDVRSHPQWVPPLRMSTQAILDPRKNPLFQSAEMALFLATEGGRAVGRVAATHNPSVFGSVDGRPGYFGFFESQDRPEVAQALFREAEGWLAEKGCDRVLGPWHPTSNYDGGLLVDGFEEIQTFFTSWNPRYYVPLVEGAGYSSAKEMVGWHLDLGGDRLAALHRRSASLTARAAERLGLDFGPLDFTSPDELREAWEVYTAAWKDNWGFMPLSPEEWAFIAHELKDVMISEGAVAVRREGRLIGFGLFLPDYNRAMLKDRSGRLLPLNWLRILRARRRTPWVRNMLAGVLPEYQRKGVLGLVLYEAVRRASDFGVTDVEISWVLEDNEGANRALRGVGATPYRSWRIYQRSL